MSESENSELELHEPVAFGQQLMLAREKAGLSVEEVARELNLKERIVEAIEDSDLQKLPPVAFVKGYVRIYARLLGISEEKIIREFETEVPHESEAALHPRSVLPGEADSQTPVIKLISSLIIVFAAAVLIYAAYSYYVERSGRLELVTLLDGDESAVLQQADAIEQATLEPGPQLATSSDTAGAFEAGAFEAGAFEADAFEAGAFEAGAFEAGEFEAGEFEAGEFEADAFEADAFEAGEFEADAFEPSASETGALETGGEADLASAADAGAATAAGSADRVASVLADEDRMPIPTVAPITGGDVLVVSAEQESWAEIVDANDIRLFYGMIEPDRELSLTGQAPFDIFLGNAPSVSLSLNATDIDMTKYIRSNNIAQFKVSVEDGRLLFH